MFSVQIAPSISHTNLVEEGMRNDMFAVAFGARAKVSDQMAINLDYSLPLSQYENESLQPKAGFSIGAEFATATHTFQIFVSNTKAIIPQRTYMYNQNDFFGGDFLIGFTITRSWFF